MMGRIECGSTDTGRGKGGGSRGGVVAREREEAQADGGGGEGMRIPVNGTEGRVSPRSVGEEARQEERRRDEWLRTLEERELLEGWSSPGIGREEGGWGMWLRMLEERTREASGGGGGEGIEEDGSVGMLGLGEEWGDAGEGGELRGWELRDRGRAGDIGREEIPAALSPLSELLLRQDKEEEIERLQQGHEQHQLQQQQAEHQHPLRDQPIEQSPQPIPVLSQAPPTLPAAHTYANPHKLSRPLSTLSVPSSASSEQAAQSLRITPTASDTLPPLSPAGIHASPPIPPTPTISSPPAPYVHQHEPHTPHIPAFVPSPTTPTRSNLRTRLTQDTLQHRRPSSPPLPDYPPSYLGTSPAAPPSSPGPPVVTSQSTHSPASNHFPYTAERQTETQADFGFSVSHSAHPSRPPANAHVHTPPPSTDVLYPPQPDNGRPDLRSTRHRRSGSVIAPIFHVPPTLDRSQSAHAINRSPRVSTPSQSPRALELDERIDQLAEAQGLDQFQFSSALDRSERLRMLNRSPVERNRRYGEARGGGWSSGRDGLGGAWGGGMMASPRMGVQGEVGVEDRGIPTTDLVSGARGRTSPSLGGREVRAREVDYVVDVDEEEGGEGEEREAEEEDRGRWERYRARQRWGPGSL